MYSFTEIKTYYYQLLIGRRDSQSLSKNCPDFSQFPDFPTISRDKLDIRGMSLKLFSRDNRPIKINNNKYGALKHAFLFSNFLSFVFWFCPDLMDDGETSC